MEILHEVWLHAICNFEPDAAGKMAKVFERETNSFTSEYVDKKILKEIGLSGEFEKRMSDPDVFKEAQEIIRYCKDNEIRIVTIDSPEYPENLKHINFPPRILFVKGERLCGANEVSVSVVGCRKASDHGKSISRLIGKSLGENNITVVSGLAEGIDGQAHRGALDSGGKTVAVLAGSVDEVYPKCHEKLYRDILEHGGTIVSERPPKTPVKKYFYQQRNRIIIGMTSGVVIVEGAKMGGTSITARLALEENRDIFAVPGNPMLWQSELPNQLLEDGATIVKNASVVTDCYKERYPGFVFPKKSNNVCETKFPQKVVSEDERILEFLRTSGGVATLEKIAESCEIGISVLSGRLTILCIKGILRQESGNRYVLIG